MSRNSQLYCVRCGELNEDKTYWIKCLRCGQTLEKPRIVNLISPSPPIKSEQGNIKNDVKNIVNEINVYNGGQNEFHNLNVLPAISNNDGDDDDFGGFNNNNNNNNDSNDNNAASNQCIQTAMDKIKDCNYSITENDVFVKDWKWRKFEDDKICSLCGEYAKHNNMSIDDKWISVSCKLAIYTQNKRDGMEPNTPWRTTHDVMARYCDVILPRMNNNNNNNNEHELSLLDKLKTGKYEIKTGGAASKKYGREKMPWKTWETQFILKCDKECDKKYGDIVIKKTEKYVEISNKLAIYTNKKRGKNDPEIPWRTTAAVSSKLCILTQRSQQKKKRKRKRRTRSNNVDIDLSVESDGCDPPKKKRKI